jgi:hypothetical protein
MLREVHCRATRSVPLVFGKALRGRSGTPQEFCSAPGNFSWPPPPAPADFPHMRQPLGSEMERTDDAAGT